MPITTPSITGSGFAASAGRTPARDAQATALWQRDRGTLPGPGHQNEFNLMQQEYARQKAAHNRDYGYAPADDDRARAVTQNWKDAMAQRAADEAAAQAPTGGGAQRAADPTAAARTPTGGGGGGTWGPEPFDPLNLIGAMGGNPYRELAKITPEGIRSPLNSAADVYEWPYWPSNIVRDHVLPIPSMLVKNGIKALDDAVEGKPLEFDPNVSAYELMWRSAQAARRKGDTETADALELLLSNPAGGRILGSLGEIAADPLTYADYAGILKAFGSSKALKAAKTAKADDVPLIRGTQTGAAGLPASTFDDGAGLADNVAGGRGAGYTKGDDAGLPGADGQAAGAALDDGAGAGRRGAEGAGETGQYTQRIRWGIQDIDVRPAGKGFFGKRMQQNNPRVDAYEHKINPYNESYYLSHPSGGYVQYENMVNDVVMDGKLIMQHKSFYHVNDLPEFAKNKVLQEAARQLQAAGNAGYAVEWLVSDQKAVAQLTDFFKANGINIVVKYLPE